MNSFCCTPETENIGSIPLASTSHWMGNNDHIQHRLCDHKHIHNILVKHYMTWPNQEDIWLDKSSLTPQWVRESRPERKVGQCWGHILLTVSTVILARLSFTYTASCSDGSTCWGRGGEWERVGMKLVYHSSVLFPFLRHHSMWADYILTDIHQENCTGGKIYKQEAKCTTNHDWLAD